MNLLQSLPTETLHQVSSYLDRKDAAALAQTNRHLYNAVNPVLYNDNFIHDLPMDSCILWAANIGRLDTIKRVHAYGANLGVTGSRGDADTSVDWADIPGRKRFFASGRIIRRFAEDVPIDATAANGTTALGVAFACNNLAAVEELLDLGADPNMVPRDVHDCGPLEKVLEFERHKGHEEQRRLNIIKAPGQEWRKHNDGARYIIAALFAACDPDSNMNCIAEDIVLELEEVVILLLRHGAPIDEVRNRDGGEWYDHADGDYYDTRDNRHYADGDSALLYACRGVMEDEPACLKMLLKHATKTNLSLEHLQEAMDTEFSDFDSGSDDGAPNKNEEVQRMLAEFMAREYPEAVSDNDG
ncbi:hypothetical protein PLIIFM63780_010628 [Purpureocillium lilacinum]|nr:hypothetical protein PLIIFM63780_010628 [Purpureocillium lilacinum]